MVCGLLGCADFTLNAPTAMVALAVNFERVIRVFKL